MKNIVYIATSLDGYIARKNDDTDWLHEIPMIDGEDYGFSKFMDRIDALVMGRSTYEKVTSAYEKNGEFDENWAYTKKVFVLSNTLKEVNSQSKGKAEIVSGSIQEILDKLHKRGFKNLYIDGGKTVQSFLEQNLIDELIITKIPIILGDGKPLFSPMNSSLKLELIETISWESGLVQSHYKVIK
ncbi:MAG: dihydrofolate reductase family protein [Salinispira sp.]